MTKLSDLHCGTYRRETWELFGVNHGQWVRVGEYDAEHKAKDAFADPTLRKAYSDGLAWCHRTVVESRFIVSASVPMFEVVSRLKGEDGEEGELIRAEVAGAIEGLQMVAEAKADPMFQDAWLVDLSTGRTVENK